MKEIRLNVVQFILIIFGVIVISSLVVVEIVKYYANDIKIEEEEISETDYILEDDRDTNINSELYEKYADKNPIWYVRDYLNVKEDFAPGAYSKSMDLYKKDELVIEDGKLYWITDTNTGPDEKVKARDVDGSVKYLILPNEMTNNTNIFYVLTDDGEVWRCITMKTDRELDRPSSPFEKMRLEDKVIDMCYINEKDKAFSNLYFLLANGELVYFSERNTYNPQAYENLDDDFFDKFEKDATVNVFDYVTVTNLYFKDASYIKVSVGENKYGEKEKEFLYIGCNEKIDKVLVEKSTVGEYNGRIEDIYFLTENGKIYSYPFGYVYDDLRYNLFEAASDVAKVEENDNGFVAIGKDGKKISINLYADGY